MKQVKVEFKTIDRFPDYEIGSNGVVYNKKTGQVVNSSE